MKKVVRVNSVFLLILFWGIQYPCLAGDLFLKVDHRFGGTKLSKDSFYSTLKGDSIRVSTLKYYISGIRIHYSNGMVQCEKDSYHLINLEDNHSLNIKLENFERDSIASISFNLGIDSITNVSGVYGGDLDPTKGMYWTWQSGYINFKLEGNSETCKSPEKEYQFHLGGYQYPFNSLEKVILEVDASGDVLILLDLTKVFDTIDLSKLDHLMSPGSEAVKLSEILSKSFTIVSE